MKQPPQRISVGESSFVAAITSSRQQSRVKSQAAATEPSVVPKGSMNCIYK